MNITKLEDITFETEAEKKQVTVEFSELLHKKIYKILTDDLYEIAIITMDGFVYRLLHFQDCCENVEIEDICGDIKDAKGLVVRAEVSSNKSFSVDIRNTWTFYKLDTVNGSLTIRFHGSSNGYYSEEVSFIRQHSQKISSFLCIYEKLSGF